MEQKFRICKEAKLAVCDIMVGMEPKIISSDNEKQPKVLFEDEDLLVIDKPAGMVVNRAESTKAETVQDWIARNFQFPISNDQLFRNGIVHRIDKETSGLLIVAKTPEAFENLQKQFKERRVKKTYLALVHGEVKPEEGEIQVPVGRLPWNRKRFGVLPGGREAITKYKVISNYTLDAIPYTLVELYPQTGRTHQIRVHLKTIGHPIVSDGLYAGRKLLRRDKTWCPRQFLHATSLEFVHPVTSQGLAFSSELPDDLVNALKKLTLIR